MNHVSIFTVCITILLISSALAKVNADDLKVPNDPTQQFLYMHNDQARAKVGVPPLVWNETLVSYAKSVAEKYKQGGGDRRTIPKSPYGENIADGYGADDPSSCVSMWLGERDNYDHPTNTCKKGQTCSEYTQVVWKKTTSFGCAFVNVDLGVWPFCVCEYYPPGNVPGQSPY